MGIIGRFKDIMASNIHAIFNREDKHPEQTVEKYLGQLRRDLGQVKAETDAYKMQYDRAQRAVDENEDEITTNVTVAVDRAYPGMDDFEQTVTVKNNGEVAAELDYKITKIEVMGDVYDINAQGSTLTSQDLEDMLDDYPFSVSITINDTALQNMTGDRSFYSKFRMAI